MQTNIDSIAIHLLFADDRSSFRSGIPGFIEGWRLPSRFAFFSMVFVEADIQWIALLVDTVTEMLAGVRAATVLAHV